jgi:hypothetical protein
LDGGVHVQSEDSRAASFKLQSYPPRSEFLKPELRTVLQNDDVVTKKSVPAERLRISDIDDPPLTIEELGQRWKCNPHVALRMMKKAGVPLMRLSSKTVRVRLGAILELERQAEGTLPHGFKSKFPSRKAEVEVAQ